MINTGTIIRSKNNDGHEDRCAKCCFDDKPMGFIIDRCYDIAERLTGKDCFEGQLHFIIVEPKPEHEDIKKYGYFLQYSPSKNKWYAAYDADKGAVWFMWDGEEFNQISRNVLPNDLE